MTREFILAGVLAAGVIIGMGGAIALGHIQTPKSTDPIEADPGYQVLKRATDVVAMEREVDQLDELCRGGSGDSPETMKACDAREAVNDKLRKAGYCWLQATADMTSQEAAAHGGYEGQWARCP